MSLEQRIHDTSRLAQQCLEKEEKKERLEKSGKEKKVEIEKASSTTFRVLVPIIVNVFSCISVVLVNKYVTKRWPFGYTLTCIHFTTTFLALALLCLMGVFQRKHLSITRVLPLSLMFLLSIVLNNLSIQHNSVCR